MIRCMIAAPSSGSGKTVITCALLHLLKERGLRPVSFKCGPDYIDPMFHRSVLGIPSHNLDAFLSDTGTVRTLYRRYSSGAGSIVCEGVMGLYDGLGGCTDQNSTWEIAKLLSLPVVLVVDSKAASLSLCAQVRGMCHFRAPSGIEAVLLNCCPPSRFPVLKEMIERECKVPVLGYLPFLEEAAIESRHLGLVSAPEISGLKQKIGGIARVLAKTLDLEKLEAICRAKADATAAGERSVLADRGVLRDGERKPRIAVARDEAFCFLYEETLDLLRECGAQLYFFSPLHDPDMGEADALYLPGGYPELYAGELAANMAMRESVKKAVLGGLPTIAECGGFLYLQNRLFDSGGQAHSMAGVFAGEAKNAGHPVRFGYVRLHALSDSLLLREGESTKAHEFHYWDCSDNGNSLLAEKPVSGKHWHCGKTAETLFASFAHLYLAGSPEAAVRFVAAAAKRHRI